MEAIFLCSDLDRKRSIVQWALRPDWLALRPGWLALRFGWLDPRHVWLALWEDFLVLRVASLALGRSRGGNGRTDICTYGRMDNEDGKKR